MRDALPLHPFNIESGIVNLNTSSPPGRHWVCCYRNKTYRIYFDSYGQISPVEIQRYLETGIEFEGSYTEKYRYRTSCEYVGVSSWGKIPFKPKKGFVLPKHRINGPYNPLHLQLDSKDNPLPGNEQYNAVDTISMRHDICYGDNDTPAGKRECNRKMLAELNAQIPKDMPEKVDRELV